MEYTTLERIDAELRLLVARRRAEQCSTASPSWDAAMGLVDELEAEIRRRVQPVSTRELVAAGITPG